MAILLENFIQICGMAGTIFQDFWQFQNVIN